MGWRRRLRLRGSNRAAATFLPQGPTPRTILRLSSEIGRTERGLDGTGAILRRTPDGREAPPRSPMAEGRRRVS
jgi:hypothetical protein